MSGDQLARSRGLGREELIFHGRHRVSSAGDEEYLNVYVLEDVFAFSLYRRSASGAWRSVGMIYLPASETSRLAAELGDRRDG